MKESKMKEPLWRIFGWSTRNVAMTINVLVIAYVSYYCTDVVGLNIGIIGTLLLASKAVDAVTDLLAGYLIDRTYTRFGKARPYEVFIILQWIFTILIFRVPDANKTIQYVYVFLMFVLINAICMTALGAADSVYLARAFTSNQSRVNVNSIAGVIIMVVSIAFSMIFPQFVNSAAGATQAGWSKMIVMLGIPLAMIGILRFVLVKEVAADKIVTENGKTVSVEKVSFAQSIKLLTKNKYALIILTLMFLTNIINNLGTINTYYFKYLIGNIGLLSIVGLTSFATPIILMFFPVLSKKLGTTKTMQYGFLFGIVGTLIRTVGGQNMTTIMIGSLISSISVIPISVMINVYLIECMDYGEWKNGTRVEGLVASIVNFAGKLGSALASGMVGLLVLVGYDGSLKVQSVAANNVIFAMYNILPLLLFIIMFLISRTYKMDSLRPQIMADLEKKNRNKKIN